MFKRVIRLSLLLFTFCSIFLHADCLPFPWLLDYQPSGFYFGAFGGMGGGYKLDCKNVVTNRGCYLGVNGGKKIFPNVRIEGDASWLGNEVNGITVGSTALNHTDGTINTFSLMANAIFDFNFPFPGSPSLGAGVGYAHAGGHWSGVLTQTNGAFFTEKTVKSSFHKSGFAGQMLANLNFFICNNLKVNLEYRFFKLNNAMSTHKFGLAIVKFF